ncbi:MAG: hypothetical protein JWM99_4337 [Verrucomicrobiales bacterium]|nr:hypothetical protein [Verrucomicrobiales bacterium]
MKIQNIIRLALCLLCVAAPKVFGYDRRTAYSPQSAEGWQILVNNQVLLPEHEHLWKYTLELLHAQLQQIIRAVPAEPLSKLRQIPIWVELAHPRHPCMCYHESPDWLREHDMNPEKAGAVELANCQNFLKWTIDQPWMVLHELAHGYHHRFLTNDAEAIEQAYQHAVAGKAYESVLRISGRKEKAYALNNAKEYFAEGSEAFFGTNDFYPFVRPELKIHDPELFELLKRLWKAP